MNDAIRGFQGEYRFLSNFEGGPVCDTNGVEWRTAEHAYQAMKFLDPSRRERIRACTYPGQAKRMGRSPGVRADWDRIKLTVMEKIVRAKFTQNPVSRFQLLATNDREIIEENTWGDRFWGVCNGVGENHLGKILMKIRNELKQM